MTRAAPKVSVIVPTYNRAAYLPATLDTLTRQSLCAPYEVIVVDDGSTDGTADAVAPFIDLACRLGLPNSGLKPGATDRRSVRYERIEHAGLPGPINLGLEMARGEYVMLTNDHDLYAPEMLAALTSALDAHPSAVLAVSDVVLVTPDTTRELAMYSLPYGGLVEGRRFVVEQLLPGIGSIAPHNMFRREALGCECLDASYGASSDVELWLRLALRGDVVHVPRALVRVRDRDDGSAHFQSNHELVGQALRAKREYMPRDLEPAARRGIEAGWRRRVDKSAAVALWRALEAGRPETKGAIRGLARREGTRPGGLAVDALTRLPDAVALAVLRSVRRVRVEDR